MTTAKKWEAALRAWEWAFTQLQKVPGLQPHEREALFCVHQMMLTRANGGGSA